MNLHMYMKCVNNHFHEINIAPITNLDVGQITRDDFDRVAQLVKEQYQRTHLGCSPVEHFGKSATVNFGGKNLVIYLRREHDAMPENYQEPQVLVISINDLFGLFSNRQTN